MMKIIHAFIAVIFLAVATSASAGEITLFEGAWTGKWVSLKGDSAPMRALVQADASTGVVILIMFQVPEPPAPSYSSMAIGKLDGDRVIIDADSSGIDGGTEMEFWLNGPMLLRGSYKNRYDEGIFEFRRFAGKDA